jgi:hypothetical protein
MSDIALRPATRPDAVLLRAFQLVPGLALLAAIGLGGKWIERTLLAWGKAHHVAVPDIEYVLWAILIGLIVTNTVGVPRVFRAGVSTYEFWLKAEIVLLVIAAQAAGLV